MLKHPYQKQDMARRTQRSFRDLRPQCRQLPVAPREAKAVRTEDRLIYTMAILLKLELYHNKNLNLASIFAIERLSRLGNRTRTTIIEHSARTGGHQKVNTPERDPL